MTVGTAEKFDLIYDRVALALVAAIGVLIALTFQVPGLAWDDHFQSRYGDLILNHIESGFVDDGVFRFSNLGYYGGLFDTLAQALVRVLPFAPHDTRHLLSALSGLLGLVGAWRFARFLGGPRAGLLALVLLAATPSYVGHMFINVKDIPFAAGYIWALYLTVRVAVALPEVPVHLALALGFALGVTLGVRIGGVLLIVYMGVLLVQHYAWTRARPPLRGWISEAAALAGTVLLVSIPAFVLAFVLWPAAWANPLLMAYVGLMETARFRFDIDVLLGGEMYSSLSLPPSYLPTYFVIKLPEVLLVGGVIAVPVTIWTGVRALKSGDRVLGFGVAALLLGAFFPLAYSLLAHSVHYDAIRHFLFVLPPLAVITALGLVRVSRALPGAWVRAVGALVVLGILVSVARIVSLYPYSYVAYNVLVGGAAGAQGRYELDYWALSYKDAAQRLAMHVTDDMPYSVYICGPQPSATPFLGERARIVDEIEDADYFLSFTRWNCDQRVDAPVIVEVGAGGARLSVVKDLRSGFDIPGEKPKTFRLERDTERDN